MVSELCLGAMTFGREIDESDSHALVDLFLDAGGNFIDTADVYSAGVSEEITGHKIKGKRDDIVLATKVRFPMGDGPNDVGVSRKHIVQGCEASLRRLGTDYIDLYQIHAWDGATPLEETMGALTDLVRQGKVRYLGLSNFSGWQVAQTVHLADLKGFERFISLQPQYSLVERNIEYEVRDGPRGGSRHHSLGPPRFGVPNRQVSQRREATRRFAYRQSRGVAGGVLAQASSRAQLGDTRRGRRGSGRDR